ncbi:toll/interleukin-1 receptor domain-containing protein [Rhizobium ruizarguesonis]|uniref:toll/interleukin-1 receptor domain-containing protein n=1 Tax=Rhizobium ruizarguesonis TaxID=2081791 RepID=UPI00103029EC|nr:toll/interleukin-1 receptor domain-containing protein [Rhizobium ruizarguesonis]TAY75149.1 toll/interleukin-1 receptor domain-containing protein [Rhizobium ruizarguesonis]TBE02281.1 toll/interleukin-1 receptor domain-containing protein [Rhizobium ruizarguesonis]TBF14657.1 toll/interleukin-1 receptor domain-containing protein [Rhizobium ruizarguesonis]
MPIFISYSQQDRKFVDTLARNLVAAKHHVWMDRWELSLGDSLTAKIEGALTNADAILVILSKNSVESEWCKRELSAGLMRELEERKVVVMPCIIDDCKIPLFLRDKLYADFRRDPDAAFNLVDQSLAKISNPYQGRIEQPRFHTDWSVDWRPNEDGAMLIRWTFVDHGHDWPYVILSECNVLCNAAASKALKAAQRKSEHGHFMERVLETITEKFEFNPLKEPIRDQFEKFVAWSATDGNYEYQILITYRRLGVDNGMDTVVHIDNNLKLAQKHMVQIMSNPSRSH